MRVRHVKTIKRDDGSRVQISITVRIGYDGLVYDTLVHTCEKGKRTWSGTFDTNDYSYRRLNREERSRYEVKSRLKVVTALEILQAKVELWENLKPIIDFKEKADG